MTMPILEYTLNGRKLFFANTPTAPALVKEIFGDNYEIVKKKVQIGKDEVILDVGANEGMFTILMAALFPEARIIALEPVPRTYFQLVRNLGLNGFKNVSAYNVGLGGPGHHTATMNVSKIFSGGSTEKCTFVPEDHYQVEVGLISLAEAFTLYGIEKCRLMKMDIEGMEYDVLYPAEEQIKKTQSMVIEIHMNRKLDFESRRPDGLANWLANRTELIHVDVCKMAE